MVMAYYSNHFSLIIIQFRYGDFTKVFYTPNSTQVNLLNSRAPGYVEPLEGENERDVPYFIYIIFI